MQIKMENKRKRGLGRGLSALIGNDTAVVPQTEANTKAEEAPKAEVKEPEVKEIIKERVDKASREIDLAGNYDYIVINDEIENAVDKILSIIRAEHAKCNRSLAGYLELIQGGQNND